jgi:hypothetical protein
MPDLSQARRKLKLTIGGLLLVDAVAVIVLLSPLVGSERSREEQSNALWRDLQSKTMENLPLRGLDKKIPLARKQIDDFYRQRLTSESSVVSTDLRKMATDSGIKLLGLSYSQKDNQNAAKVAEAVGLNRMGIEAELSGDYLQVMHFINSLERSQLFFLIDSVELGSEQSGVIHLRMKLETYVKTGA